MGANKSMGTSDLQQVALTNSRGSRHVKPETGAADRDRGHHTTTRRRNRRGGGCTSTTRKEQGMSLRNAIDTLGRQLGDTFAWGLYGRRIRQQAIEETDDHPALTLCPLATAVCELPQATIDKVLADEAYAELRAGVERECPDISEHLAQEEYGDGEPSEPEATRMALAAVIADSPRQDATTALLGIDRKTISALASAADDVNTPKGRRLVRALSTPNNTLREECRAVYGARGL